MTNGTDCFGQHKKNSADCQKCSARRSCHVETFHRTKPKLKEYHLKYRAEQYTPARLEQKINRIKNVIIQLREENGKEQ